MGQRCGAVQADAAPDGPAAALQAWQVQFYDALGNHLTTLRVPGGGIRGFDWEAGGLRMVLVVDHFIYFASIKPNYRWAALGGLWGAGLCWDGWSLLKQASATPADGGEKVVLPASGSLQLARPVQPALLAASSDDSSGPSHGPGNQAPASSR
jgi:hypothetical protein